SSCSSLLSFFLMIRLLPLSPLFPYTTLFRSRSLRRHGASALRLTHPTSIAPIHDLRPPTSSPWPPRGALRPQVPAASWCVGAARSEEHTSELQSLTNLVCRLLLEKKNTKRHSARIREGKNIPQRCSHA